MFSANTCWLRLRSVFGRARHSLCQCAGFLILGSLAIPAPTVAQTAPEMVLQMLPAQSMSRLALSPDGKVALMAGSKGIITGWDPMNSRVLFHKKIFNSAPQDMCFSPDGKTFVAVFEGRTGVWDATTLERKVLLAEEQPANFAVFHPNGKTLATGGPNNLVLLWDVATAKIVRRLAGHEKPALCAAYSPKGDLLATGSADKTIRFWDPTTGAAQKTFVAAEDDVVKQASGETKTFPRTVTSLAFSDTGALLAAATPRTANYEGGQVRIFSVPDATMKNSFTLASRPNDPTYNQLDAHRVVALAGGAFASAGRRSGIQIYKDGERTAKAMARSPVDLAVTHDETVVVLSQSDESSYAEVALWHPATNKRLALLGRPQIASLRNAQYSADGVVLLTHQGGYAYFWDGRDMTLQSRFNKEMRRVQLSADGKRAAVSPSGWLSIIDTANTKTLQQWEWDDLDPTLHFSPDAKQLFVKTNNSTTGKSECSVWNTETGKEERRVILEQRMEGLHSPFSPDGRWFAACDDALKIFDTTTGKVKQSIKIPGMSPYSVLVFTLIWTPDSKFVGLCSGPETPLRLYDVETGQETRSIGRHLDPLRTALTPDGRTLAVSTYGQKFVYDFASGALKATIAAEGGCAAISPDGQRLVVIGDGIEVWDVLSGKRLTRTIILPRPEDYLPGSEWVTIAESGHYAASPGAAPFIKWRVNGMLSDDAGEVVWKNPGAVRAAYPAVVGERPALVTPALPAAQPLAPSAQAVRTARAPLRELARFRFMGNGDAERGGHKFRLTNTAFRDDTLYLNGIYSNRPGGYAAMCDLPETTYDDFAVALRFKADTFAVEKTGEADWQFKDNLISAGTGWRWFSLRRSPKGYLEVTFNNQDNVYPVEAVRLEEGQWTTLICSVDVAARHIEIYKDGNFAAEIELPQEFSLRVKDKAKGNFNFEKDWSFSNSSNSAVFQGLIDEFIVYNRGLTREEAHTVRLGSSPATVPATPPSATLAAPVPAPAPPLVQPAGPVEFLVTSFEGTSRDEQTFGSALAQNLTKALGARMRHEPQLPSLLSLAPAQRAALARQQGAQFLVGGRIRFDKVTNRAVTAKLFSGADGVELRELAVSEADGPGVQESLIKMLRRYLLDVKSPGAPDASKASPAIRTPSAPPVIAQPVLQLQILQGEKLTVLNQPAGVAERQGWAGLNEGAHLWWRDTKPGEKLVLGFPVATEGAYQLVSRLTQGPDYGIVQLYLDGQKLGNPIDLYSPTAVSANEVAFEIPSLAVGDHQLSLEMIGANAKAVKRYMAGLDFIKLSMHTNAQTIEGEKLIVRSKTAGIVEPQVWPGMSGGAHLWWRDAKPGAKLVLELPISEEGAYYQLVTRFTQAADYGLIQLYLDDKKLGNPIDLYSPELVKGNELAFYTPHLPVGNHQLTIECVGANEKAIKRHMMALDYVKLSRRDQAPPVR